ncbi:Uncharacterised protein [Mycobacteroides abscessus subsp. abscessus]|uniref:hypothetical protein n=1 Tax=Mycobacteroides abscessus TaxID=36809 RepID=UPI00092BE025|nr:hypothetical protein [Mycobacteroides abscessus]SHY97081.1 Uncharacterised protein [Mycobacteroides abscessus subsp. abscessus]SIH28911.1 Uncharacterised protein [Mycobacteroides abscessus subsp. abscessus]SKN42592.1 Uncharacterised protein [Mycobacteroides abscessus subsp. abscessus]SLB69268.1 Uncharacterised protein [Mycobacteroides abscessus subsp. abscessus]
MGATSAHQIAICNAIAAAGNTIKACSGDPGTGTNAANVIASTPASFNTTWPSAADGSGGDAGYAVALGSAGALQIPASTVVSHYAIFNGSTYLRGHALDTPITVGASPVSIDIAPKTRYKGGQ